VQGLLWSLMSAGPGIGGFIDGRSVFDVSEIRPGLLRGRVECKMSGELTEVDDYEFFAEQFVRVDPRRDWRELPDLPHITSEYRTGAQVKVYARQCWRQVLDSPVNGTVYQNQCSGNSVLVSVDPRLFESPCINSRGGTIIEVYPHQLRRSLHKERHPVIDDAEQPYDSRLYGGFQRASQYRNKKPWWKL